MSKGQCPDIDKYLKVLRYVLDGESTPAQEQYLADHLGRCSCCLEAFELEKQVRQLLKVRIEQRTVPQGLASTIRAKILQAGLHDR